MCVLMNKELAIVGLINAIALGEAKKGNLDDGILPGEGIDIGPDDVINYCNYLTLADYGPVLKNFDTNTIKRLFESKSNILKNNKKDKFTIYFDSYKYILPNFESSNKETYFKKFRKLLIKEFLPDLNYHYRFLKFMKLCD